MQNWDVTARGLNPVSVCRQFTVRLGMEMASKRNGENGSMRAFSTESGSFIMVRLNPATAFSNADAPFPYRAIPVSPPCLLLQCLSHPPSLLLALRRFLSEPLGSFLGFVC